jgi:hypothetical protein
MVRDSFTLHTQFAFGHGGDQPGYVGGEGSLVRGGGNAKIELAAGGAGGGLSVTAHGLGGHG